MKVSVDRGNVLSFNSEHAWEGGNALTYQVKTASVVQGHGTQDPARSYFPWSRGIGTSAQCETRWSSRFRQSRVMLSAVTPRFMMSGGQYADAPRGQTWMRCHGRRTWTAHPFYSRDAHASLVSGRYSRPANDRIVHRRGGGKSTHFHQNS